MERARFAQGLLAAIGCISFVLTGCASTKKEPAASNAVAAKPNSPAKSAPTAQPAAPPKPAQFFIAQFASSAEGWTLAPWQAAPMYDPGVIVVSTADGNPAGSIESTGAGDSNNTDACTREGGQISKIISTAGYKSIKLEYDLFFATNMTGSDCNGKCEPLEESCADKLVVYYSTTGLDGPWMSLEKVDAGSVSQAAWQHRSLDLADHAAANNNPNFALRFKFQFNNKSDVGRLDNIQLTGTH